MRPMTQQWGLISQINPDVPATWRGKKFLTLDLDWAPDYVLEDTLSILQASRTPATLFVTHHSDVWRKYNLESNGLLEIGVHPNFNFLLSGDHRYGASIEAIVQYYRNIAPSAKSIRSHSMTQSTLILHEFVRQGFTHDCNMFVESPNLLNTGPWRSWVQGLTRVPYIWEDDVYISTGLPMPIDQIQARSDFHVFDFHPIHIFLNTHSMSDYEAIKHELHQENRLTSKRHPPGSGVRDIFLKIIE